MSEVVDMLIALIWSSHIVYMQWKIILYLINTYNYYMSIKEKIITVSLQEHKKEGSKF
jgi:hypothetical protein